MSTISFENVFFATSIITFSVFHSLIAESHVFVLGLFSIGCKPCFILGMELLLLNLF